MMEDKKRMDFVVKGQGHSEIFSPYSIVMLVLQKLNNLVSLYLKGLVHKWAKLFTISLTPNFIHQ